MKEIFFVNYLRLETINMRLLKNLNGKMTNWNHILCNYTLIYKYILYYVIS